MKKNCPPPPPPSQKLSYGLAGNAALHRMSKATLTLKIKSQRYIFHFQNEKTMHKVSINDVLLPHHFHVIYKCDKTMNCMLGPLALVLHSNIHN